MRLDLYILEECAKARKEGMANAAKLAQALTDAGRADEIAEVLADEERYDALVREFGLDADNNRDS